MVYRRTEAGDWWIHIGYHMYMTEGAAGEGVLSVTEAKEIILCGVEITLVKTIAQITIKISYLLSPQHLHFQLFLLMWKSYFWVHMLLYSWRSIHSCINYYCLSNLLNLWWFIFSEALDYKSKFNFDLFSHIFEFPCYNSTHKVLSTDWCINYYYRTDIGKLGCFQHFGTSQNTGLNSISTFLKRKENFSIFML